MRGVCYLALCMALILPIVSTAQTGGRAGTSGPPAKADQLAKLGSQLLAEGAAAAAKKYCEGALEADPAHTGALKCLAAALRAERDAENAKKAADQAAEQAKKAIENALSAAMVESTLAEGEAKRRGGDAGVVASYAAARQQAKTPEDVARVTDALRRAHPSRAATFFAGFGASWIMDVVYALTLLAALYTALLLARSLRRMFRKFKSSGEWPTPQYIARSYRRWREERRNRRASRLAKTNWVFTPIEDKDNTGINMLVLDALERMRVDLEAPVDIPTLVPLRPTKGEPHEAEVWKDFRVHPPRRIKGINSNVSIAFAENSIDLTDAVGQLQVKVGGVELGSVAKMLRGIQRWFNAGVPTIAGSMSVADKPGTDGKTRKEITVRLSCSAYGFPFAAVVASTEHESTTEAASLAAERAAYKLAYAFATSTISHAQADGLAARRQGIALLQRYVACGEDGHHVRRLGLEKAVFNLHFAREALGALPAESVGNAAAAGSVTPDDGLVECELLLFEGIGEALLGNAKEAAELFRTIRDIVDVDDPAQLVFRLQALYNHAILEQRGALAEPAFKQTPATIARAMQLHEEVIFDCDRAILRGTGHWPETTLQVVRTVQLLSRFGYISAASQWSSASWVGVEEQHIRDWVSNAQALLHDLDAPAPAPAGAATSNDRCTVDIMRVETNKAFARISVEYLSRFRDVERPVVGDRNPPAPIAKDDPAAVVALHHADARAADRGLIARTLASLAFVVSRQTPDMRLLRLLTVAHLLAQDVARAGTYGLRAINVGGDEELYYFAAALAAMRSGRPGEAVRLVEAFKGKMSEEFAYLGKLCASERDAGTRRAKPLYDLGDAVA